MNMKLNSARYGLTAALDGAAISALTFALKDLGYFALFAGLIASAVVGLLSFIVVEDSEHG